MILASCPRKHWSASGRIQWFWPLTWSLIVCHISYALVYNIGMEKRKNIEGCKTEFSLPQICDRLSGDSNDSLPLHYCPFPQQNEDSWAEARRAEFPLKQNLSESYRKDMFPCMPTYRKGLIQTSTRAFVYTQNSVTNTPKSKLISALLNFLFYSLTTLTTDSLMWDWL